MALARPLLLLLPFLTKVLSQATPIYINEVPLYSQMASCAEAPVSSIVRDMYDGCGDHGATTSYTCFCTASSSIFNHKIATAVSSACNGTAADVSTALEVYQSYCAIGLTALSNIATTTSSLSSTPTSSTSSTTLPIINLSPDPTSTPTHSLASSTSTSSPISHAHTSPSSGAKAGIIIGSINASLLLLYLCIFLFRRRRRRHPSHSSSSPPSTHPQKPTDPPPADPLISASQDPGISQQQQQQPLRYHDNGLISQDGTFIYEKPASGEDAPRELPSSLHHPRVELASR